MIKFCEKGNIKVHFKDLQVVKKFYDFGYLSVERLGAYIYKATYDYIPKYCDKVKHDISGGCSSFIRDGKLYRNLDFHYDNNAEFIVVCKNFEGMAFISGMDDGELNKHKISQLPYHINDGVNRDGIMVSSHILFNDWQYQGSGNKDKDITLIPFTILNNLHNINDIHTLLDDFLANAKMPDNLLLSGYAIQYIVSDGITTYAILPPNEVGGDYSIVNISENPKMTNFRWVEDKIVDRVNLQLHPMGVERYNLIESNPSLKDLRFTKCYEEPTRLSEFIGIDGTTKDSTDEELLVIYNKAHAIYENRQRDGTLWQTCHSVIYSRNGMESLFTQENYEKDYIISGKGGDVADVKVDGVSVVDSDKVANINIADTYATIVNLQALESEIDDLSNDYLDHKENTAIHTSSEEKAIWNGKSTIVANPEETSIGTLTKISIDGEVYTIPTGGRGTVINVLVDGESVVDEDGVANITLSTTYATKTELQAEETARGNADSDLYDRIEGVDDNLILHKNNTDIHTTATEKASWATKTELQEEATIRQQTDDANYDKIETVEDNFMLHKNNADIHTTASEKASYATKTELNTEIDNRIEAENDLSVSINSVQTYLNNHTSDTAIHTTQSEKNSWATKTELADEAETREESDDELNSLISTVQSNLNTHTSNGDIHVNSSDKSRWDAKSNVVANPTGTGTTDLTKINIDGVVYNIPVDVVDVKVDGDSVVDENGIANIALISVYATKSQLSSEAYTRNEADSALAGRCSGLEEDVEDIQNDITGLEAEINTKSTVIGNPTDTATTALTKIKIDNNVYSVAQGSGDVADVKVDGISVVGGDGVANITISSVYASQTQLNSEANTRSEADTALAGRCTTLENGLDSEITNRTNDVSRLDGDIQDLEDEIALKSTVEANPTGTPATVLSKIKINDTIYNFASAPVTSVNGRTGPVVITGGDIYYSLTGTQTVKQVVDDLAYTVDDKQDKLNAGNGITISSSNVISVNANGSVAQGNTGVVNGGTVHTAFVDHGGSTNIKLNNNGKYEVKLATSSGIINTETGLSIDPNLVATKAALTSEETSRINADNLLTNSINTHKNDNTIHFTKQVIFDILRPVNSHFVQYGANDNPNTLFNGNGVASTWVEESMSEQYIQFNSSVSAGTAVSESLPNIKGTMGEAMFSHINPSRSGAFGVGAWELGHMADYGLIMHGANVEFNAAYSNGVYQDNAKIHPQGRTAKLWRRSA